MALPTQMEKIYTFPHVGRYTPVIANFFRDLDVNILEPPLITKRTVELGAKYSPEMICLPYKLVLGTFIEAIEKGVNNLILATAGNGTCRFENFYVLMQQQLEEMGYDFNLITIRWPYLRFLREINANKKRIPFAVKNIIKNIIKVENEEQNGHINIGVVGEVYTMMEDAANMYVREKLKRIGANTDISLKLSTFLKNKFKLLFFSKREERREAKKWMPEKLAGHGFDSLYNTIWYCKNNYDGVLFVKPFICAPENTVEAIIQRICKKYKKPLLILNFDENISEQNINTRLEAFIECIKIKKEEIDEK